jgi:hypothetical protein
VALANGWRVADVGAVLDDDVRVLASVEGAASAGREGRSSGRGPCVRVFSVFRVRGGVGWGLLDLGLVGGRERGPGVVLLGLWSGQRWCNGWGLNQAMPRPCKCKEKGREH